MSNYTPHARAAVAAAADEAKRTRSPYIGPEHLLYAVLTLPHCGAVKALTRLGVSVEAVQQGLQSKAGPGKAPALASERQEMKLLESIGKTAKELKKPGYVCIGTEHLLLGILNETDSLPAQVLQELGVTAKQIRRLTAESGGWPSGRD